MRAMWIALWVVGVTTLFPHLAQSQNVTASPRLQANTTWHMAEAEGRLLWVSERSVSLQLDERTQAEVGWQQFVAKGRVRTNRFSTSSRWFAVERVIGADYNRQLILSVRRMEGSEGTADVAEGLFTYVAPRIDTASLLSLERTRNGTKGYRLSYSRIHAGTEAADTIGIVLSAGSAQWQLWAGVYADRHGDTTYRAVLGGSARFSVGPGVHAQLGATLAPRGLPFAGTPIEALTAFALYRPGGLVESWRDRPAGYLTLQITAGR